MRIVLSFLCLIFFLLACGHESTRPPSRSSSAATKPLADAKPKTKTAKKLTKEQALGKKVFLLCTACHGVKDEDIVKIGPNLKNIFGRKAGTYPGFEYSQVLIDSDITWNEDNIKEWMSNPTDFLPGNKMAFVGVKDEKQQDALIAYLKMVTKE